MGRKNELNLIYHTVGRWLAAAEEINGYMTVIGRYQIEKQTKLRAPSDEGAVVFRRKMTEGEKAINSKFSLSLPQFRYAQQLPRQREPVFQQIFKSDKSRVLTL